MTFLKLEKLKKENFKNEIISSSWEEKQKREFLLRTDDRSILSFQWYKKIFMEF